MCVFSGYSSPEASQWFLFVLLAVRVRFVARGRPANGSSFVLLRAERNSNAKFACFGARAMPVDGQTLASRLCLIFGQSGFEPWAKSGPAAARTAAASASSGPSRSPSSFWLRRTGTVEKTTPPLRAPRVSASPVLPRPVGANQQKGLPRAGVLCLAVELY